MKQYQEIKYMNYIDIIKTLGIILVVMGHSTYGSLQNWIYLFHMPLFFFVTGYLYKEKYDLTLIIFIKRKLNSLYKPYLLYSLLFLFLHNLLFDLGIYGNSVFYGSKIINKYGFLEYIKQFIKTICFASREPMLGALWFFATMFFSIVIFCIIRYITRCLKHKDIIRNMLIVIIFLIGTYSIKYNINIPRFSNSLTMLMFINLGFIFKTYETKISINGFTAIISFGILLICNRIGHVAVNTNTYTNALFLIIASMSGIYLTSYLSKVILKFNVGIKQFHFIGKSTIIVMALQFISFKIIVLFQIEILSLPMSDLAKYPVAFNKDGWWIAYSVIGVIVPITLKYLFNKCVNLVKINKINARTTGI